MQPLKHLPEVVTYVRKLEARIEDVERITCLLCMHAAGHVTERPVKRDDDNVTLATELCNGEHWLVGIDKRGVTRYLAHFSNPADCATFTRAFGLAKASAHAHGQLGI